MAKQPLPPVLDIAKLDWQPAGPAEDSTTHLMASAFFGKTHMIVHAVEVLIERDGLMITKSELLEHMLFGVDMLNGRSRNYLTTLIQGRSYLLFALPAFTERMP